MRSVGSRLVAVVAVALLGASCTVNDTEAPAAAGPSELALSLAVQATPDLVIQDGASQSSVTIDARGPSGQPVRAVSLRVDMLVDGSAGDFGTLSARTVVTGDDGRARVIYTVPPRPLSTVQIGSRVTLTFTPLGTDYRAATARQVDISVIPPGVILPPNRVSAVFSYSPTSVVTAQPVFFDASNSTDNGVRCASYCSYSWDFGDGSSGSGVNPTHEYRAAGSYVVRLRVVNANGQVGESDPQTISVGAGNPPKAEFTYSPANPAVSQDIFFNASASTAAPGSGRRIIAYDWDFGTGRTATGVTVAKRFDTAGTFRVTLVVTDDAFQSATTSQSVTVGGAGTGLIAGLTISPTDPKVGASVQFNASSSRGPSPIVEYRFNFGDGTSDVVQTSPLTGHIYVSVGTYVATVRVRDSSGRVADATVSVPVTAVTP